MLVTKIENTYYSRRVDTQGHNSVFQTVINSWSGSWDSFRNRNQVKNLKRLKTDRALFPGTFIFAKIWAKRPKIAPNYNIKNLLKIFVTSFSWERDKMKTNTRFFIRKPFFCLSLSFLNIMLGIRLRFSEYFFLTFIPQFSLILYLIRFNTNNKRHFLNNGETK